MTPLPFQTQLLQRVERDLLLLPRTPILSHNANHAQEALVHAQKALRTAQFLQEQLLSLETLLDRLQTDLSANRQTLQTAETIHDLVNCREMSLFASMVMLGQDNEGEPISRRGVFASKHGISYIDPREALPSVEKVCDLSREPCSFKERDRYLLAVYNLQETQEKLPIGFLTDLLNDPALHIPGDIYFVFQNQKYYFTDQFEKDISRFHSIKIDGKPFVDKEKLGETKGSIEIFQKLILALDYNVNLVKALEILLTQASFARAVELLTKRYTNPEIGMLLSAAQRTTINLHTKDADRISVTLKAIFPLLDIFAYEPKAIGYLVIERAIFLPRTPPFSKGAIHDVYSPFQSSFKEAKRYSASRKEPLYSDEGGCVVS